MSFQESFGKIVDDLKNSWYFRIWTLFFLTLVIVFIVGFSVLAHQSGIAATQGAQMVISQPVEVMEFPRFHFRVFSGDVIRLTSASCHYLGLTPPAPIRQVACSSQFGIPYNTSSSYCMAFVAEEFIATKVHFNSSRIQCNILATPVNSTETDALVAFEVEGSRNYGINDGASIWIAPNNNAWVLLTKLLWNEGGSTKVEWERFLLYHSTVRNPGVYNVQISIGDWYVDTYINKENYYTGWMVLGDIGGVAILFVFFHMILMFFVGLCISNTSSFLKHENSPSAGYSTIPGNTQSF